MKKSIKMLYDDGSTSFWNFLHVSGFIYGICVGVGMIAGYLLGFNLVK